MGSDVGVKYAANFDVAHLAEQPLLAVVADGMGDSEGSALAGRTAVDTFVEEVHGSVGPGQLRAAVALAQDRVIDIGRTRDVGLAGCTLTALADGGDKGWWITHIGDSRAYRLRGDLLELLTNDHTNAWTAITHGIYAFDSPHAERGRYQLTRYVGHQKRPEPDVLNVNPAPGDVFLLCSDGISDQIPFLTLREILSLEADAETKVRRLLEAADDAGGGDNATAAVVAVH
ncbi:serine/threonine protein phosphatase PrpC [Labedaea rhizosphaerae]|uniref:Serine/threonine protein phosphatase PrpC n=2 Tax=Labedaea rhizosphaerae TaxID=598644 RepID=A0A4R6S7X5_LABRH|nr:serine/threonine protein phosphatase PrpC [Labedaea rhizosphaerae]